MMLRFFFQEFIFLLLYSDDLRLQANGKGKYRNLLLGLFIWVLAGTPFGWKKTKGGLTVEWVGYLLDYCRFEVGITEARSAWLISWAQRIVDDGLVQISHLGHGLGRLGFCAGVLEWTRPFLAPLYAWVSAAPGGSVLPLPLMVTLTLTFLINQLKKGRRMTSCRFPTVDQGTIFKTDAKGEDDFVVLGGWECRDDTPTHLSRWFSVKLTKETAPWLFDKGHGSRTIASSELLGTMLAVHLFCPLPEPGSPPLVGLTMCGGDTDNKGNSYVVQKLMTTKLPLLAVLMQLSVMLSDRNVWLNLNWVGRLFNVEADALTNSDFSLFDEARRIPVVWSELPLDIMNDMLAVGLAFEQGLNHLKAAKRKMSPRTTWKSKKKVRQPWG